MLKTALHLEKIATLKDKSVKITASTPELSPEAMMELFSMHGCEVACVLQKGNSDNKVVENVDTPVDGGKTPSSRLRSVLYIDWKENTTQSEPFDIFYTRKMESIIDHIKSRLPEL